MCNSNHNTTIDNSRYSRITNLNNNNNNNDHTDSTDDSWLFESNASQLQMEVLDLDASDFVQYRGST